MKKILFASFAALMVVFACQKKDVSEQPSEEPAVSQIDERKCAAEEVLQQQMAADPTLRARMEELENFTRTSIASGKPGGATTGSIEIPVVVNVLYNTAAENISDAQIASQLAVLNEDFKGTNSDISKVTTYSGVTGSMAINFVLDTIIRKQSNKNSWGTNDAMKKSSMGGIDPTDPTTKLNMWSCNLGRGLLGYAQFPGGSPATDGVVVLYSAFGSRKKNPTGVYIANYDLGRTATHEVGHWLNLRHIWGDATCGSDLVGDTPAHNTSNGGCPPADHRSTCTGTPLEMWMNYMDYTYDGCMYMFTDGQVSRMEAVFVAGGPRSLFR